MIDIQNQIYVVIQTFFLGCFLELLYEIHSSFAFLFSLRKTRIKLKIITERLSKRNCAKGVFIALWDVTYFLCIIPICAIFLYGVNSGILRWYLVASAALGFVLNKITLGRVVNFLLDLGIGLLKVYLFIKLKLLLTQMCCKLKKKGNKTNKRRVLISINEKQGV